jgi:hypothetical protein
MRRFAFFSLLIIYVTGLVYLSLPSPKIPSIPHSFKSDEPGDTIQHPDQPAYYTNLSRNDVLKYLQSQFSLQLNNLKLPSYRLNYRPEDSTQYVREQLLTYYLEEIVYPLRESLFVNGWNPRLSPISAANFEKQYDRWAMIREGREYQSRITLRAYYSPLWIRLFVWTSLFPLSYLLWRQTTLTVIDLKKSLHS